MPLRVALTGRRDGPELPDVVALLGIAETRRRLQRCSQLA
jgi:glutamyl/glutaminyl-tRNA synthetase